MARLLDRLVSLLTPKRRWFQFRLRTLFLVMTVVAVAVWSIPYLWPAAQAWYARYSLIGAVGDA